MTLKCYAGAAGGGFYHKEHRQSTPRFDGVLVEICTFFSFLAKVALNLGTRLESMSSLDYAFRP